MSRPVATSDVSSALARDRLGVRSIIFFVLTMVAPLMVVGGVVSTGWAVTGITGFPLAFVIVGLVLALFVVGYVTMARHVINAGALYAYTAHGLGRVAGVAASFVAIVAYNALQVGLYGVAGPVASGVLDQMFGVSVSWWVCSLVIWALVATLGVLRVDINSKVLAVLLVAEIAIVVVIDAVDLGNPAGGSVSFATFAPDSLFVAGLGAVLVTCLTAFTGFEAAPVFAEESRHPRRTVPIAAYSALAIMTILYAVTAWAMSVAVGPGNVVNAAREQQTELIFNTAAANLGGGTLLLDIGHVLLLTSIIAGALSFHNTCARYLFALGRERVLPAVLGRTSARSGAPVVGSAVQSLIGLVTIVLFAAAGWDPLVRLFFSLGMTGGFGVLLLITLASLAVVAFFARNPRGEGVWQRMIAPFLAFALLLTMVWLTLDNYATLLGVPDDSPLRWQYPGIYAVAAALGVLWALVLRSARPNAYAAVGLGPAAVSGAPAAAPAPAPAGDRPDAVDPAGRPVDPAERPAPAAGHQ